MSRNKRPLIFNARAALDDFKQEVTTDESVRFLNHIVSDNGDAEAANEFGKFNHVVEKNIGGEMVKRMIENAEKQMIQRGKDLG